MRQRNPYGTWACLVLLLSAGFALSLGAADAATLALGEINPLTGRFAAHGTALHRGIQLAVEEANASGTLRVTLATRDDEARPDRAVAAAEELITRLRVAALVGGYVGEHLWRVAGWSPILAMPLAAAFGLVAAEVAGNLTGAYFSLATLAMGEILRVVALHWTGLTEGAWGLVGVPGLPRLPVGGLARLVGTRATDYYAALLLLAAMCGTQSWIQRAPLGLALQAIRQCEARAVASGVDARRVKRIALAVSGLFAGGAGALHDHIFQWVEPASAFSINLSVLPLIMAMFGGSRYLLGPVLGAVILYFGNELIFQRLAPGGHLWLYGGAVILVILALPHGILGWVEALLEGRRGPV
jgi:branched-chain amino acid transport system permease protein